MLKKSKDEEIDPKVVTEEVAVEVVNTLEEAAGAEAETEVPVQDEAGAEAVDKAPLEEQPSAEGVYGVTPKAKPYNREGRTTELEDWGDDEEISAPLNVSINEIIGVPGSKGGWLLDALC